MQKNDTLGSDSKIQRYQIINLLLSLSFILTSIIFAYLIEYPVIILIITPIILLITYYEQKSEICPRKYSRYVYLVSILVILGVMNFWIIPLFFVTYPMNIQVIVFSIVLYLLLQYFIRYDYFRRENVIIAQHLLAFLTFLTFIYSLFPILSFEFSSISNESIVLILNILTHVLINLCVLLSSFYYLYIRQLQIKSSRFFNISIMAIFLLIEFVSYAIINLMNFFLVPFDIFIQTFLLSVNLIPVIFLGYVFLNYILGIIPEKLSKKLAYILFWNILIMICFSIIVIFYYSFRVILITLLCFSIISQFLVKFGFNNAIISEKILTWYRKLSFYLIYLEVFILAFTSFFELFQVFEILQNLFLSTFFSLVIITVLHNVVYSTFHISKLLAYILNTSLLFFTNFLVFFYSALLTLNTFYIFLIPITFSSIFLNIPLYYLKTVVKKRFLIKKLIIINSFIVSIAFTAIPSVISLEMIKLGYLVDIVSTFNFSIYILYIILGCIYIFSRSLNLKENSKTAILKSQVFIEIIIAFTTVFYYLNVLLKDTLYGFILPILATSAFLYIPLLFSYKKNYFLNLSIRRIIIVNTFIFWICIISTPSFIALELAILGFNVDSNVIILVSIILWFIFLKFLDIITQFLKIKEKGIEFIKICQIFSWIAICILVSRQVFLFLFDIFSGDLLWGVNISISLISFLLLNILNLSLLESLKQITFENRESKYDYYKIYKIYEYNKNLIYFGLIFAISLLISLLTQQIGLLSLIFIDETILIPLLVQIGIFMLISLLLLRITSSFFEIEFVKTKLILEAICWFVLKIIICLILIFIPFNISFFNRFLLVVLVFSVLSPISLYFLSELFVILDSSIRRMKKIIIIIFLISALIFFSELYWLIYFDLHLFAIDQTLLILNYACIVYLFLNFVITYYHNIFEGEESLKIYKIFGLDILLSTSLLLINSSFFIFFLLLLYSIILYNRNRNIVFRIMIYLVLSIFCLIEVLINFNYFNFLKAYILNDIGFFILIALISIISVLLFSVIINAKRENFIENHLLYILFSLLSYFTLLTFTLLPQIYSLSILILVYLLFIGVSLYRRESENYKWYIGPCILIFIFDFIFFSSDVFLFTGTLFYKYKAILGISLTLSITGLLFILIYNSASKNLRKYSFIVVLGMILGTLPTFIYFLLISLFALPILDPIALIVAINVFIFLFYLSIGIYQGKISWQIWRTGWWLWIICPIANFYIIYESFAGVDLFTKSLSFFGLFTINGSFILSIMICIVISLPFWYSWIKKHFSETLLIVWGLSLFALYWLSQNIFADNIFFTNFLFILFAIFLLIPIFFWMKVWKLLSLLWTIFSITMVVFLFILFSELGFIFEINFSLNIMIGGTFFIIASFFPTFQAQKSVILILSYSMVIIGIFLTVYNINYLLFLNFPISLAISLIIIGMSLFSSKLFKLNQSIFNFLISIVLIFGFSLLSYITFSLIPNFELFSVFLTITVAGISFFAFNHYKMLLGIKKIIPISILSIGLSLTLSNLVLILFSDAFFLSGSVFIAINLIFLYYLLYEKRFIMLYLFPLPFTIFFLEFIRLIEIFQPLAIFILIGLMLYTTFFQLILNILNPNNQKVKEEDLKGLKKFFKNQNQVKVLNFLSLVLNSTYFSLFIAFISQLSILYKIIEFFIIWSILILISFKYYKKWGLDKEFVVISSKILKFGSLIALFLYFEISILMLGLLMEFFLLDIQTSVIISLTFYFLLNTLDIYVIKKGYKNVMHILNIIVYTFLSIYTYIFLNQFTIINSDLALLFIIILLLMQFYTNYATFNFLKGFNKYDNTKLDNLKGYIKNIILNLIYITISLYSATLIVSFFQVSFLGIYAISLFSLYIMIFSLLMYFFNYIIKSKFKPILTSSLFIVFQLSLGLFWVSFSIYLNLLNLFNISLILIAETTLSFYSTKLLGMLFKEKIRENIVAQIYSIITIIIYFELSFLVYSISNLILGIYESLLASQISIFLISFLEIDILKRMKVKYMLIIQLLSYLAISLLILVIFSQIYILKINFVFLSIVLLTLMQFYTNYLYFKIRKLSHPEKENIFIKWKKYRQNILGICFYIFLIVYISQNLLSLNLELQLFLFIISLITHLLIIGDNFIFKFIGKYTNIIVLITWALIFGFSFLYFLSWIPPFSIRVIPVIILLLLLEILYLYKTIEYSTTLKFDISKIKKVLIYLFYFNFTSWPLYYATLEVLQTLNLILFSLAILLLIVLIDRSIGAINNTIRKKLIDICIMSIGFVLSVNIFLFLEFYLISNFLANLCVALLPFMLFLGYLLKPFKRKKILSFAYWTSLFILLSIITYNLTASGFSWGILLFGAILYPFIFMLEELKLFLENIATFIKISYYKVKNAMITMYYSILNFLIRNFKYVKVVICFGFGISIGILFSDIILGLLNPLHSFLLTFAVFGILYGLIPGKKTEDLDEIFEQKMKRFIIIWISTSLFIYILILPYIESFIYSLILMTSSILGLGAILLIFIYRKEKKKKISIKWRFYTTIVSISLVIFWVILILIWYFTEVRI